MFGKRLACVLALALFSHDSYAAFNISGDARTLRSWDCCKPSCAWRGKADFTSPVLTCGKDSNPLLQAGFSAGTACNGGDAYMCADNSPWAINDTLSYGFASAYIKNHLEDAWCCSCYELAFTDPMLKGKKMIIQAQNSLYDDSSANWFSIAIPGGNTNPNGACAMQYGVSNATFGRPGEGVPSRSDCDAMPEKLREGCRWRFDWFQNSDNPSATFTRVTCPAELTKISSCTRRDDSGLTTTSSSSSLSSLASAKPSVALGLVLLSVGLFTL